MSGTCTHCRGREARGWLAVAAALALAGLGRPAGAQDLAPRPVEEARPGWRREARRPWSDLLGRVARWRDAARDQAVGRAGMSAANAQPPEPVPEPAPAAPPAPERFPVVPEAVPHAVNVTTPEEAQRPPAATLLVRALGLQDSPTKVYGWIENSYTGNTNGKGDGSNFSVFPNRLADAWQGNQYYLILENALETTDQVNLGFR